jgi:low temperature requirement protein LtrA
METRKSQEIPVAAALAVTLMMVVGLGDMSYGYYTLLRLVTCGVAVFLAFGAGLAPGHQLRWVLMGVAVVYNPVLPVHLGEKELWSVVNAVTVILFWMAVSALHNQIPPDRRDQ